MMLSQIEFSAQGHGNLFSPVVQILVDSKHHVADFSVYLLLTWPSAIPVSITYTE